MEKKLNCIMPMDDEPANFVGIVFIKEPATSLNPENKIGAGKIPEISGFANNPALHELINKVSNDHLERKILKPVAPARAAGGFIKIVTCTKLTFK
jgi:hypothetical protein